MHQATAKYPSQKNSPALRHRSSPQPIAEPRMSQQFVYIIRPPLVKAVVKWKQRNKADLVRIVRTDSSYATSSSPSSFSAIWLLQWQVSNDNPCGNRFLAYCSIHHTTQAYHTSNWQLVSKQGRTDRGSDRGKATLGASRMPRFSNMRNSTKPLSS